MRRGIGAILLLCLAAPGCMTVQVGVQNPIPGMTTIAVVPFFNLSQEPSAIVDGRRFALAYYAELQKTQGFQVIPVGVVEAAIQKNRLDMSKPVDCLALAAALKADAVVVGAVTDYSPYYPPRIGMQVDWYSPREWKTRMIPPDQSALEHHGMFGRHRGGRGGRGGSDCAGCEARAQSPGRLSDEPDSIYQANPVPATPPETPPAVPGNTAPGGAAPAAPAAEPLPPPMPPEFDPTRPLMSYTRMFDGADQELVNKLKDYLDLRGDRRSGGWEGCLQRSEDYIRFTSHLMIVEMLSLHGGAVTTETVFHWKKFQYP